MIRRLARPLLASFAFKLAAFILLGTGVYLLISPPAQTTTLAHLHPDIWWGAVLLAGGLAENAGVVLLGGGQQPRRRLPVRVEPVGPSRCGRVPRGDCGGKQGGGGATATGCKHHPGFRFSGGG